MNQPTPIAAKPMRDALLARIHEAMATDTDIFFVTADFGSPVLDKLRSDYPERVINVGIAEQNLINVSAGLALEGYKVFAYAIAFGITALRALRESGVANRSSIAWHNCALY